MEQLKDSGTRRQFEGGAVRDRGDLKPRPDLISPHPAMREGMILALGAEKYDLRNWEKGMPISECIASATRHLEKYKLGLTDEDHLAMSRVNLGFAIHYEEEIKNGGLDPKWDDMPKYAIRWDLVPGVDVVELPVPPVQGTVVRMPDGREFRYERLLTAKPEPRFLRVVPLLDEDQWGAVPSGYTQASDWYWDFKCPYPFDATSIPRTSTSGSCYVAGPMRGYAKLNFPTFDLARDLWADAGWNVTSPADMDRQHGVQEDDPPRDLTPDQKADIIKRDCEAVCGLDKRRGDCLVVLPGWEKSKGSAVEVALARFLGLPVVQAFNGEVVSFE